MTRRPSCTPVLRPESTGTHGCVIHVVCVSGCGSGGLGGTTGGLGGTRHFDSYSSLCRFFQVAGHLDFFQVFFSSYLTTSLLVYVFAPARVAALSLISSSSPLLLLVPAPPPPSSSPPRACSSFSPFLFSPSSSTNTSPRCCFCSLSPLAVVFAYCPPPPSSPPLLGDSRDEAGQILSRKVFASSPHSSSSPPMSFPHNSRQKSNLSSGVRTVRWHALVGNAYTPAFRDK